MIVNTRAPRAPIAPRTRAGLRALAGAGGRVAGWDELRALTGFSERILVQWVSCVTGRGLVVVREDGTASMTRSGYRAL